MFSEIGPATLESVHEFYSNIDGHCDGYFMTWLRGQTICIDTNLISTLTYTSRVHDSIFPWLMQTAPPRAALVECFIEGRHHSVVVKGTKGFKLNDMSVDCGSCTRSLCAGSTQSRVRTPSPSIEPSACMLC